MFMKFFIRILSSLSGLRRFFWSRAYQFFSARITKPTLLFMNYGWEPEESADRLAGEQEPRLFAQLYARTLGDVELEGKDVLEIGCGRGGGSAWLALNMRPRSMTGVDFSPSAVDLCRRVHTGTNLHFETGDAENLSFDDESFDVLLNVESSHCYGDLEKFMAEVKRVLRPGGFFCWADMWTSSRTDFLLSKLDSAGLRLLCSAEITDGVVRAMDAGGPAKEKILREEIPFYFRPFMRPLMGMRGGSIHRRLLSGEIRYLCRTYVRDDP
jgi:ubiquinone/menaquinone biosynthesis C-methylase UbiE